MIQTDAAALWSSLIATVRQLVPLKAEAAQADRSSLIDAARASLATPLEQRWALEVLVWLDPAVTLALLDDVVRIGALSHRDALLTRQVLGRLPRRAIAKPLHAIVDKLLDTADDDGYRRLAELAQHLGLSVALGSIVDSALASADPHTREVGEEFQASRSCSERTDLSAQSR